MFKLFDRPIHAN